MSIAEGEIGQHEVDGSGNNSRIVEYHSTTSLRATQDSVPWCSSCVNWCLKKAGIKGTDSAAAKSWLNWGEALAEPTPGCICVIRQRNSGADPTTGSATGYHVGFWLRQADGRVYLLGGNQSDQVKISSFGLGAYSIVGYRMPTLKNS